MGNRKPTFGKPLKEMNGGYRVKPELDSNKLPTGKFAVVTGRKTSHAHGLSSEEALTVARNLSIGLNIHGKKIKK